MFSLLAPLGVVLALGISERLPRFGFALVLGLPLLGVAAGAWAMVQKFQHRESRGRILALLGLTLNASILALYVGNLAARSGRPG